MISKKAVERTSGGLIVAGGASWLAPHIAPKDFSFVHQNEGVFQTGGEIVLGLGVLLAFGLYVKNYHNKGLIDVTEEERETAMPFIVPSEPGEEAAGRRNDQRFVARRRRQQDS